MKTRTQLKTENTVLLTIIVGLSIGNAATLGLLAILLSH